MSQPSAILAATFSYPYDGEDLPDTCHDLESSRVDDLSADRCFGIDGNYERSSPLLLRLLRACCWGRTAMIQIPTPRAECYYYRRQKGG